LPGIVHPRFAGQGLRRDVNHAAQGRSLAVLTRERLFNCDFLRDSWAKNFFVLCEMDLRSYISTLKQRPKKIYPKAGMPPNIVIAGKTEVANPEP